MSAPCPSGKLPHRQASSAHGAAHHLAIALNAEGKLAPSL